MSFFNKKLNLFALISLLTIAGFANGVNAEEDQNNTDFTDFSNSGPIYEEDANGNTVHKHIHNTLNYNYNITETHNVNIDGHKESSTRSTQGSGTLNNEDNEGSSQSSKTPSFISRVARCARSSFLSAYDASLSWASSNPRSATLGIVGSLAAYKLYNHKTDIKEGINKKYRSVKQNIVDKKDDLEDDIVCQYLDFREEYDNLIDEGKTPAQALSIIAKKSITRRRVAYTAAGAVGSAALVTAIVYYKDAIKNGLIASSNSTLNKMNELKTATAHGVRRIDSSYAAVFQKGCNWLKNNPQYTLIGLAGMGTGWLGYKSVKAANSSSQSIKSLNELVSNLSKYQIALLKDDRYFGEDNFVTLLTEAADNIEVLKSEQKFYNLLSPKQQHNLELLIQSSLL